jgi:transposase InsO family protein
MMRIFLNRKSISLSNPTVHKYMNELGLRSIVVPKKPKYKKGDCYKKFDNLLNQNFKVDEPNKIWCTDFTYMWREDGAKRYNCTIIDLYDRSPVATLNSNRINAELAIETLTYALNHNTVKKGLILHSDQGSQFTSRAFTEFCSLQNITQSMSKAGCPYDNAPMESFYGTFKADFANHHSFETDEALNEATYEYIFVYYNHVRPHSSNGYLTPFEKRFSYR